MDNNYIKLAGINVNNKIEKKNGLSYLSWAWAVDQLMREDPTANWAYLEPAMFGETMMVRCSVTAFGKTMTSHLPVMDHRNKPIANPDAFQVNTAMQRCLVKAIALHGLGLYIYAGEDLPESTNGIGAGPVITPTGGAFEALELDMQNHLLDIAHRVSSLIKKADIAGAWDELTSHDKDLDENGKVALWSRLDSKERSALKKEADRRKPEKAAA
jgi:hypothetical protein